MLNLFKRIITYIKGQEIWNEKMSEHLHIRIISMPKNEEKEKLFCYLDDTDVEFNTPIVLTEEQKEKQKHLEKDFMERHSDLFE